tara:strand:- start:657 stop:1283 length:627 start_codon:yes stop_codon:yes gene_type:complete
MRTKIIDNFLNQEDLQEITSLKLKEITEHNINVYHNKISKENVVNADCLSDETVKRFHKNYHHKALELLKELYPEKVELYDYSEFHIIQTGSHYKFPIHDDTPSKLLSGVVYIKPENNKGTMFFDTKKGENKKNIEWKKNRAVFFARKERETWHSYEGDGKSSRITLVYNLMTNKIKKVYEIEKKSYLIGNFRYKVNPYLYQYFKFLL